MKWALAAGIGLALLTCASQAHAQAFTSCGLFTQTSGGNMPGPWEHPYDATYGLKINVNCNAMQVVLGSGAPASMDGSACAADVSAASCNADLFFAPSALIRVTGGGQEPRWVTVPVVCGDSGGCTGGSGPSTGFFGPRATIDLSAYTLDEVHIVRVRHCVTASCTNNEDKYIAQAFEPIPDTGPLFADLEDPPSMTLNPLIVTDLCPTEVGFPTTVNNRDVKITLPTNRTCTEPLSINGGNAANPVHNVWIVGGKLTPDASVVGNAGITVLWFNGTVFIEGVDIDIGGQEADAIRYFRVVGIPSRVVVQNSRLRGMGYGSIHGDIIHGQGNPGGETGFVGVAKMQNVRAETIKQGIFLPWEPQSAPSPNHGARRVELDYVEIVLDPRFQDTFSTPPSMGPMIFLAPSGPDLTWPPDGQSYNEVWLGWVTPWYPGTENRTNITLPSPTGYNASGYALMSAGDVSAGNITWTGQPANGPWRRGNPPSTFVPLNKIGLTYDRSFFTGN